MALVFLVCSVAQGAFSGTLKPHVSKKNIAERIYIHSAIFGLM